MGTGRGGSPAAARIHATAPELTDMTYAPGEEPPSPAPKIRRPFGAISRGASFHFHADRRADATHMDMDAFSTRPLASRRCPLVVFLRFAGIQLLPTAPYAHQRCHFMCPDITAYM